MSWVITALLLLCLGGSHLEWGTLQIAAGQGQSQGRGQPNPPGQSGSGQGRGQSDPRGRAVAAQARQNVDAEVARQGRRTSPARGPRRPFRAVASFLGSSDTTRRIGMSFRLQQETVNLERDFQGIASGRVDPTAVFTALRSILRPNDTAEESDEDVMPGTDIGVCPFPRIRRCNRRRNREFRTLTGVCNNLQRPLQGRSNTPFIRRLAPDYSDDFNAPRTGKNGALPSARDVSVKLFENVAKRSGIHTHLIMSIGQFLDHDLTRTAISSFTGQGGEALEFECGPDGCDTNGTENRPCFPIKVTKPDRAFNDRRCLMFVRTEGVPALDCKTGPRQQLNQLTGYIDASNIYGSTGRDARRLRERSGGRLKVLPSAEPGRCKPLLPRDRSIIDCDEPICFNAGDKRVNENAALSVIHTVFVREHNLIAAELARIHGNWNDQRLYQKTRKLMGAIWQHIVYNEYLPAVLGSNRNLALKLPRSTGFGQAYQKGVDASIVTGFATAAFRFPHSMVSSHLEFASNTFSSTESVKMSEVLRRPGEVFNNNRPGGCGVSSIAFGLLQQKAMVVDRFIPDQITDRLFSPNPPTAFGTDLMSINIQRGRDHGIPGYNEWRVEANLPRARSFSNLGNIPYRAINILGGLYNHVDDVDLFAGGLSEKPDGNGLLGKTFKEIISEQFVRLRVGDRFFYDNNNNNKKTINFNKDQLKEIRKMSIARILCDTLDDVRTIQPYALLLPLSDALRGNAAAAYSVGGLYRGGNNKRVPCRGIAGMDFRKF